MARTKSVEDVVDQTLSVNVTKSLAYNIKTHALEYNLTMSEFLRAILEAVDDEKLYKRLLG